MLPLPCCSELQGGCSSCSSELFLDCRQPGLKKIKMFLSGPHCSNYTILVNDNLKQANALTSCREQITSSVHLPSHFPILEGSGRGLEPRRLRGNVGSPVRSRLPARLSSHHPPKVPQPPPATLAPLTSRGGTHPGFGCFFFFFLLRFVTVPSFRR